MIQEVTLAVIQALTEFLPVSSSGHLALFGNYFGNVNLFYFTLLHFASVLAILIYTRKEIKKLFSFDKVANQMWLFILIGILPAGIVGFFFYDVIAAAFSSLTVIACSFLITGVILLSSYGVKSTKGVLNAKRSLAVGLAQVLALFPGISRSGITIATGLFSGLSRKEAFRFSFLMAIPLILAATLVNFSLSSLTIPMLVGFVICFVVSLLSLKLLEVALLKNYFWVFGIYCILLSIYTFTFVF